jgi:rhamnosyltransferase
MKTKPLMAFKAALISDWEQANQVTLHDWFIYAFLRSNNYPWIIDSEYKMRYRQHEHNQVGVNKGFNARIKRLRLLRNGWYKEQVLLIAQLVDTDNSLFTSRWHLLKKITQLRRDWKDRLVLCACVLMGLFK